MGLDLTYIFTCFIGYWDIEWGEYLVWEQVGRREVVLYIKKIFCFMINTYSFLKTSLSGQVGKKILTQDIKKKFSFFHDAVALFILYFYLLTPYIMLIWNDLFTLKQVQYFLLYLYVCSISKMPSKVFVITTCYIYWSLNQGGRAII